MQQKASDIAANRDRFEDKQLKRLTDDAKGDKDVRRMLDEAQAKKANFDGTRKALSAGNANYYQAGKSGVDLAINSSNLRNQCRLEQTAQRNAYGRNCFEIGGVWIDEKFDAKTPTLVVKAQSDAYFRILELQPKMKDVYRLGLTDKDGWTPPKTGNQMDAAKKWLKDNAGKYRIQRFVAPKVEADAEPTGK